MNEDEQLIRFTCPICDAKLATSGDHAEAKVECGECSTELIVPDPTSHYFATHELIAEEAPARIGSEGNLVETEMDMTPMVDVTFLLLIFFMVTAAFTMQKSFQIPTPEDERPSENVVEKEEEDGVITVRIDEYNTFYVSTSDSDEEREAPSEHELRRALLEAKKGSGGAIPNTLIVQAHVDAVHERVIMAMDLGTELEMEQVKLRTIEDDG